MRKVASSRPKRVSRTETARRSAVAAPRSTLGDAGIAVLGRAGADEKAVGGGGMRGGLDELEHEGEGRRLLMRALERAVKGSAALDIALGHGGGDLRVHRRIGPGIAPGRRLFLRRVGIVLVEGESLGIAVRVRIVGSPFAEEDVVMAGAGLGEGLLALARDDGEHDPRLRKPRLHRLLPFTPGRGLAPLDGY